MRKLLGLAVLLSIAVPIHAQQEEVTTADGGTGGPAPAAEDPFGPPLTFPAQDLERAIVAGTKMKGKLCGLDLQDSGRALLNAMAAPNDQMGSGFSLELYTPVSWIQQRSSNASKEYRTYAATDVTRDDLAPVLRVVVYPDVPSTLNARDRRLADSVQHVVIRDETKKTVAQPLAKEPFSKEMSNGFGARAEYAGVRALFSLEDLARVRAASPDKEFFITVIGEGKEKNFKIKKKHFERLPGL